MYVHITSVMNWQDGEKSTPSSQESATWSSRKTSSIPSANSAEQNCIQKHRLGTLLHSNRMEKESFRIRVRRNVENVCNSSKSQSTRINCNHCRTKQCTQENRHLPSNPIFRTQKQLPDTRISDCQYKDNGNNAPDSKCEPRKRKGQEILPKASIG